MAKNEYKPDCGYAWMVVAACFIINFIMAGLSRAAGVLYIALIETYAVSREVATTPFSLRFCIRNMSGPIVGVLGQRFGIRSVVLFGGIICGVGGVLCSVASNLTWITIGWGGFHGLGYGMCNIIHVIILNRYFNKYKGLALGICLTGDCFGTFLLPILLEFLLSIYDVKGTYLILAGISLNAVPAAMLLRSPPWDDCGNLEKKSHEKSIDNVCNNSGVDNYAFDIGPRESVKENLNSATDRNVKYILPNNEQDTNIKYTDISSSVSYYENSAHVDNEIHNKFLNIPNTCLNAMQNNRRKSSICSIVKDKSSSLCSEKVVILDNTDKSILLSVPNPYLMDLSNIQRKASICSIYDDKFLDQCHGNLTVDTKGAILTSVTDTGFYCVPNNERKTSTQSMDMPEHISNLKQKSNQRSFDKYHPSGNGRFVFSDCNTKRKDSNISVLSCPSSIAKPTVEILLKSVLSDQFIYPGNVYLQTKDIFPVNANKLNSEYYCTNQSFLNNEESLKKPSNKWIDQQTVSHDVENKYVMSTETVFEVKSMEKYREFNCEKTSTSPVSEPSAVVQFLRTNIKPIFLLISATMAMYVFLFISVFTIILDYASDNGIPSEWGKYLLVSFSVMDVFGRLGFGVVLDKKWISLSHYAGLTTGLMGLFIFVIPFSASFVFWMVSFSLCGFIQGGNAIMYPILVQHYMEKNEEPVALGCLNFYGGILMLPIPPMIGFFRDNICSYDGVFWTTGGLCIFAGCLWILEPCLMKFLPKKT